MRAFNDFWRKLIGSRYGSRGFASTTWNHQRFARFSSLDSPAFQFIRLHSVCMFFNVPARQRGFGRLVCVLHIDTRPKQQFQPNKLCVIKRTMNCEFVSIDRCDYIRSIDSKSNMQFSFPPRILFFNLFFFHFYLIRSHSNIVSFSCEHILHHFAFKPFLRFFFYFVNWNFESFFFVIAYSLWFIVVANMIFHRFSLKFYHF